MKLRFLSLLAVVAMQHSEAPAQPICAAPSQCEDLSPSERRDLIAMLQKAQRDLKAAKWVPFTLLLGAMASNEMAMTTPREAFLRIDFAKVYEFKRVRTNNRSWRQHRLMYVDGTYSTGPMGKARFHWEIDVVLGFGTIHQVSLIYRPPAPH